MSECINIDKSGANTAAIKRYSRRNYSKIKLRKCKYLNTIVAQDYRMIKKNHLLHPENLTYKLFISLAS